ncbi:alginate O-acetyltransferase complex protein AlgI [Ruminococcus flavefaciens]|uniref:Alginate O-acetyltransferase complex protein AlgI n=1 Tax=Ruminococcus flavefaciens TaxID=1265 RepID=A0A1H6JU61_RUMFL|nr:MBOAT family O-acyltransferase [Ruminococcus flavefaciens]SEH62611.1 alginate O-acetyltransferase complex protein AlgI [Ruminococcus flavefaciens]
MVYSSLMFIYGFLPVALLLYYLTPKRFREYVMLFESMAFCCFISLYFLLFIAAYSIVNYLFGQMIGKLKKNEKLAAIPLTIGIIFDLIMIFGFRTKYFVWLHDMLHAPEGFYPIGISFFTLSAIGTLIDTYKGRIKADMSFVRYSLYIMFFPRIIMGPLLRYGVFAKVLDSRRENLTNIGIGMSLFIKGLAKKVIAADNLYMLYSAVRSSDVSTISAANAWLGITAYLFCLYFNLSGFADMGTGIAYCFGLKLPQSFNYPLLSTRIKYFAARWQSQVIQWLRRYITKPLYSACTKKWIREIVFVGGWTLFGFWYTVSLNGVICGLIMGIALIIENYVLPEKVMKFTGIIYTFLVVILCTVFLSGDSLAFSVKYLLAMLGGNGMIADAKFFYLVKSYIVLILITMYASTSLFRNMMIRSGKAKIRSIIAVASPLIAVATLIICTALISYSGSSDMLLIYL